VLKNAKEAEWDEKLNKLLQEVARGAVTPIGVKTKAKP